MPRSVKDSECYLPIQKDNLMVRAEKGERAMWTASREDRAITTKVQSKAERHETSLASIRTKT